MSRLSSQINVSRARVALAPRCPGDTVWPAVGQPRAMGWSPAPRAEGRPEADTPPRPLLVQGLRDGSRPTQVRTGRLSCRWGNRGTGHSAQAEEDVNGLGSPDSVRLLPPAFPPQGWLHWEGLSLPQIPPRTPDSCFLPHALHRLGFTGKASVYPRCLLTQTSTKKGVSKLVHRGWEPRGPPFHGGASSAVQVRAGLAGAASPSRCCCRRCGGCGTPCATGARAAVGYMAAESRGGAGLRGGAGPGAGLRGGIGRGWSEGRSRAGAEGRGRG